MLIILSGCGIGAETTFHLVSIVTEKFHRWSRYPLIPSKSSRLESFL